MISYKYKLTILQVILNALTLHQQRLRNTCSLLFARTTQPAAFQLLWRHLFIETARFLQHAAGAETGLTLIARSTSWPAERTTSRFASRLLRVWHSHPEGLNRPFSSREQTALGRTNVNWILIVNKTGNILPTMFQPRSKFQELKTILLTPVSFGKIIQSTKRWKQLVCIIDTRSHRSNRFADTGSWRS